MKLDHRVSPFQLVMAHSTKLGVSGSPNVIRYENGDTPKVVCLQ